MSHRGQSPLQLRFYEVIFGTQTPPWKWFDIGPIAVMAASAAVIMLDSIASLDEPYGNLFLQMEWVFTIFFNFEG